MSRTNLLAIVSALLVVVVVLRLVVLGRLRAKYAGLWLILGVGLVVLSAWPAALPWLAGMFGFQIPANLLFFAGLVLLLLVGIHLSLAVTRLENHVQRLAEEVALLTERESSGRD